MLEVVDLECVRGDKTLFRGLSFRLSPGELLHVQGANGSGKTTLLRSLCGLSHPAAGEIRWRGRPTAAQAEEFRAELSYLGHLNGLQGELSGRENLDYSTCLAGDGPAGASGPALERLGLKTIARLPAKLLSQGQKRRLALARLLTARRALWVLDEPFAALDLRSAALLGELLGGHLAQGGMVILTSHQEVAVTTDRILTLRLDA